MPSLSVPLKAKHKERTLSKSKKKKINQQHIYTEKKRTHILHTKTNIKIKTNSPTSNQKED